ncbi:O-antigen ligase family protein [Polaribacter pectinis]|uniref:O-antigen ligase family protein n=1 Tax=Polaribacter pectinis TaxID=2738844 RepID=A0A7G9L986_9FLAO|nr:O-antigen ligase family protein [Polaribacter pectinis]QNM85185.1 O-antigen ligase family protein [Polaribacter pectinis]
MKVNIKIISGFLLILALIIQREVTSLEINTILLGAIAGFLIILNKGLFFKKDFELFSILILIILIGIFSSFFNAPKLYNFARDLIYFAKPLILILIGYSATRLIKDWKVIFKIIIYLGLGYAILHILHTLIYTDFKNASVSRIRNTNGLSNIIEIFSIALIILGNKTPAFKVLISKRTRTFFLTILTISFILYFSRTMLIGLIILVLGVLNYLKLNRKGLKYGLIFLILMGGLYTYLYNTELDRQGNALESFLYKMKIAPEEVFSPKLNLNNKADLWDHWRAYEAYCAFQGLNESPISYISGKGLGALIDLKFSASISSEGKIRHIPILHNGYVFILFKTGVLGLFLYLFFLFKLYFQAYRKTENLKTKYFGNLLSATALYLILSSLIITGLYNVQEETTLLLGIFVALKSNTKNTQKEKNENRDNRN